MSATAWPRFGRASVNRSPSIATSGCRSTFPMPPFSRRGSPPTAAMSRWPSPSKAPRRWSSERGQWCRRAPARAFRSATPARNSTCAFVDWSPTPRLRSCSRSILKRRPAHRASEGSDRRCRGKRERHEYRRFAGCRRPAGGPVSPVWRSLFRGENRRGARRDAQAEGDRVHGRVAKPPYPDCRLPVPGPDSACPRGSCLVGCDARTAGRDRAIQFRPEHGPFAAGASCRAPVALRTGSGARRAGRPGGRYQVGGSVEVVVTPF